MKQYAFGVDVGGTTVKLGLFTTEGQLLDHWEIPTRKEDGGREVLPDIARTVLAKLQETGLRKEEIEGIGIGIPGPVLANGTLLRAVNIGWKTFNVQAELSRLTGLKVKAGNDANVAALGEMWMGGGNGCPDMVMVTLGTGVGGGVIVGGKILNGENGSAGEIGHIPVLLPEDEPEACGCGKHGCLEQYCSATGVVRLAKQYLKAHPEVASTLRTESDITAKDVFMAAAKKDAAAVAVTDRMYRILGIALAAVAAVVNPRRFVIGGGVSHAGKVLTDGICHYYRKYAFPEMKDVDFALAALGNHAGIFGAVKLLIG